MALINCKECGKEVSTKAKSCPHCGATQKNSSWLTLSNMLSLLVIAIFIPLIIILGGRISGSPEREAQARNDCAKALLDGARVTSYVDKQAYDKVIADKCAGYNIPK